VPAFALRRLIAFPLARKSLNCLIIACGLIPTPLHDFVNPKPIPHATMSLINYLKGQFLEIIEWTDDSRDTLSFRFADEDKEIKNGAQLIVRESQTARVRLSRAEFGDTFGRRQAFAGDGQHPHPDARCKGWKYALQFALQGGRVFGRHAPLHRQQVGR